MAEASLPMVLVRWVDSMGHSGWLNEKERLEFVREGPDEIETAGLLLHRDERQIVIVQSQGRACMDMFIAIPMVAVRSIRPLVTLEGEHGLAI